MSTLAAFTGRRPDYIISETQPEPPEGQTRIWFRPSTQQVFWVDGDSPASSSILFATAEWGGDFLAKIPLPAGGTLHTAWWRLPDQPAGAMSHNNALVFEIFADNWSVQAVGTNGSTNGVTADNQGNTMLFGPASEHIGDFSLTYNGGANFDYPTDAQYRGWIGTAVWIKPQADGIYLSQWTIYGGLAATLVSECRQDFVTLAEIRGVVGNSGYEIDLATNEVQVGRCGTTISGTGWVPGNLSHYKAKAAATRPTQAEVVAFIQAAGPDTSALVDLELLWSGGPVLTDRSGNGRHGAVESGGTLYQGAHWS